MEDMLPLKIEEGQSCREMWDDANFKVSLQSSGLYEARASACWVQLRGESFAWNENELSEKYWEKRTLFPTLYAYVKKTKVVEQAAGGANVKRTEVVEQATGGVSKLKKSKLKKSFKLYSGHQSSVVATWWLELAHAVSKGDTSRVEQLVQAGLTVTLQVREVESAGEVCCWAISASLSEYFLLVALA
mgnify:CR=1 FL=1